MSYNLTMLSWRKKEGLKAQILEWFLIYCIAVLYLHAVPMYPVSTSGNIRQGIMIVTFYILPCKCIIILCFLNQLSELFVCIPQYINLNKWKKIGQWFLTDIQCNYYDIVICMTDRMVHTTSNRFIYLYQYVLLGPQAWK